MLIPRFVAWTFWLAVIIVSAGVVSGQDFPNKPIRIVTTEPGGGTDFISRIIAQGISGPLGQNVIVDNRGSTVSPVIVSNAPPDGYTLLVAGSTFMIGPLLQKTSYDPIRDFSSISMLTRSPSVLVVHPSVAVKSIKELIALAKAKPGVLNYASSGNGSFPHLTTELFKSMAGINMVRINYKSSGQAVNALVSGEVQVMFPTAATVAPFVKSGKLRALAVTGSETSVLAPDLPTVAAAGVPDFEAESIIGLFAPAKTPAAVITRLNQEIVRVANRPDVKEKFFNSGVESVGSSPEQLAAKMKSQITRLGAVIKDSGIKAD